MKIKVGDLADAQTEARAIALDVFANAVDSDDESHSMDMPVAIDIIVTALAAKDAELAAVTASRDGYAKDAAARADECDRLRAALAEARNALNLIDALDPEEHIYGVSHDACRGLIIRMGQIARRVLTGANHDDSR